MKISIVIPLLIVTSLLVSCSDNSTTKQKNRITSEITEYFIELETTLSNERQLNIEITTNFPDRTKLLVDVERPHTLEGKKGMYSGTIFSKDIPVGDGKILLETKVNDQTWYNEYQGFHNVSAEDFPAISEISDSIRISVLFSPKREQLKEIITIVGEDGQNVQGSDAEINHGLTTVRKSKMILIPLELK